MSYHIHETFDSLAKGHKRHSKMMLDNIVLLPRESKIKRLIKLWPFHNLADIVFREQKYKSNTGKITDTIYLYDPVTGEIYGELSDCYYCPDIDCVDCEEK